MKKLETKTEIRDAVLTCTDLDFFDRVYQKAKSQAGFLLSEKKSRGNKIFL
jgi:hypothetical protein